MKAIEKHIAKQDMQSLLKIIEEVFKVQILANNRMRETVDARMVFSKILRERGHTFSAIARFLSKDHSTIIHYVSQCRDILQNDKRLLEMYIECNNTFLIDKEPLFSYTDRDLVKELISLRKELGQVTEKYQSVMYVKDKYRRIEDIINLIDSRTPVGNEFIIKKKINELLNGIWK